MDPDTYPSDGHCRVVIDAIRPCVDGGQFPVKRLVGEPLAVEADVFADGHDVLRIVLQYRYDGEDVWQEVPMEGGINDLWKAEILPEKVGLLEINVAAWVDHFATWTRGIARKFEDGQSIEVELLEGARHLEQAAERAEIEEARVLRGYAEGLRDERVPEPKRFDLTQSSTLRSLAGQYPDRARESRWEREVLIAVERTRSAFSAWYEFFPRSWGKKTGEHGTLKSAQKMLEHVADLGFDIVYLPPVHPIGKTFRKGKNNSLTAEEGEPGSPWAIGSADGGHKDINPALGTLKDFDAFVKRAGELGLEVALDIAFQCSPDHPYVKEHPEWFTWRPDGSVQYAENPPKKYQDILPFNFECEDWKALWEELRSVFIHWIERGVKVFRVDNPHTKPIGFWEWCMRTLKQLHPDVIFLSEAFTRPKVKYRLGRIGFTQGYTYFTWRNTREELTRYLTELTQPEVADIFWPNFWPNTPDILHECLQVGGRPAFMARAVLAATLSSNYGVYGPAFELCDGEAFPGREEYNNNEKYEIKQWDLEDPTSIAFLLRRLNQLRRDNPALQRTFNLTFVQSDNPFLMAYLKHTPDLLNIVLTVVNLDFNHPQEGWLELPLETLKMGEDSLYMVTDLLPESEGAMPESNYMWQGSRNYVKLEPNKIPAHILRIYRKVRRENDFDYWL